MKITIIALVALVALVALTAACGTRAPSSVPDATVDLYPVSSSPALAHCYDPEGPLHPFLYASELTPLAIGPWVRCSGAPIVGVAEELGVELDADGTYAVLGDDGSGGVIERRGFAKTGIWHADDAALGISPAQNIGGGGPVTLEDNPRRLAIRIGSNATYSIYAIAATH